MLLGVTLAALNAFLIARGVGRPLAQRVIAAEMDHEGAEASNAVAKTMANVQAAIDEGGLGKQFTAIALLRLTPVVPFSASNYLLGLTPVQVGVYSFRVRAWRRAGAYAGGLQAPRRGACSLVLLMRRWMCACAPPQLPAFVGGTVLGMSVWSALYASLGGASRALLDRGADMETLLAGASLVGGGRCLATALGSHRTWVS